MRRRGPVHARATRRSPPPLRPAQRPRAGDAGIHDPLSKSAAMSAASARGARPAALRPPGKRAGPAVKPRKGGPQQLEHRILLTATLCLLAFGAVMVYSASSATTLLQGRGNG